MAFRSRDEILQDILDDFKEITDEELSPTDLGREEVIKFHPISGAISAFHSELQRTRDDIFPASSSEEGLEDHLEARQIPLRIQPQPSQGIIKHTGIDGSQIEIGNQIERDSDGKIFIAFETKTIGESVSGEVEVLYKSLVAGQEQNIANIAQGFTLVSAVEGVDNAATNTTPFSDGRNLETPGGMLDRIINHDQNVDTGGNLNAYERFAKEASPLVVTATAIDEPRGPDTVDTVITSGTTDIEAAVESGTSVVRIPSAELINIVQAFVIQENPTTDDHQTIAPTETNFDLTISFDLFDEILRPAVDTEIQKITKIFIFEAKAGSRLFPTELERRIDQKVGHLIKARRVENFDGSTHFKDIPNDEIFKPNIITLQSFP